VTATQGGASATIVLHPQELGTVEIRLHYGDDGITATVHAENPQAAQTLQQAAPDLRRALQAQGMTLLQLDVRDGREQPADGRPASGGRTKGGSSAAADGDDEVAAVEGVSVDPSRLPAPGSSVDVLA
jgi:flagellar hook-length control protein FliK